MLRKKSTTAMISKYEQTLQNFVSVWNFRIWNSTPGQNRIIYRGGVRDPFKTSRLTPYWLELMCKPGEDSGLFFVYV